MLTSVTLSNKFMVSYGDIQMTMCILMHLSAPGALYESGERIFVKCNTKILSLLHIVIVAMCSLVMSLCSREVIKILLQ